MDADSLFIVKVISSFIVGGGYIALVTRVSEVLGAKLGAVITATPTTALIGMIFLALSGNESDLASASPGIIVGLGAGITLIVCYVHLHKILGTLTALLTSIIIWFVFVFLMGQLDITTTASTVVLFLIVYAISVFALREIPEHKAEKKVVTINMLLMRALFAGTVIASAQIAARIVGPFWGGIATSFPAMFISTIVILEREQSHHFTASIIKHLPLGIFSILAFAITLGITAEKIGSAAAILVSFAVSLLVSYFVYLYKSR